MRKFVYASVRSAVGVSVTITLTTTLVGLAGSPGIAAAVVNTATWPVTDARHHRVPLKRALLGSSDLPAGYTRANAPFEAWVDIPPTNFGESCPPSTPTVAWNRTHAAVAAFVKWPGGPTEMYELLVVTGSRNARAAVAETATASQICPPVVVENFGSQMTVSYFPMPAPRLGDASAGIRYVMRTSGPQHVVEYRDAIMVAWRSVFAMDVVPVVFGSGKRYFGSVHAQHLLADPDVVIQGNRVLHLRYRVRR